MLGIALLAVTWGTVSNRPSKAFRPEKVNEFTLKKQHVLHAVAFTPDGKMAASAGDTAVEGSFPITVWDTETGKEEFSVAEHKEPVYHLAFSRNGRLLASASGTWKLWDVNTHKPLASYRPEEKIHPVYVFVGPFSADGKYLAVCQGKETFSLANVATVTAGRFDPSKKTAATFDKGLPSAIAISPDSKTVAMALGGISVNDIATGREKRGFWSGGNTVQALAFSPNSTVLAVAGWYRGLEVHLLPLEDQTMKEQVCRGHKDAIFALAFAPDGKMLATGSNDGQVKLWDPATGKELHSLQGHPKAVRALAFSKDGKTLFSAGDDDMVRVWRVRE